MEEEARAILREALATEGAGRLVDSSRRRFAAVGFVELKLPLRKPMRDPPEFK